MWCGGKAHPDESMCSRCPDSATSAEPSAVIQTAASLKPDPRSFPGRPLRQPFLPPPRPMASIHC